MIFLDFIALNGANIYLATILLSIFKLNDKKLIFILIIDIILNNLPIVTILILLLYLLKNIIFNKINKNFLTEYILIISFYFIFGITLYGVYNEINLYIIKYLLSYLIINMIIYYLGIKIIRAS